MKRKIYNKILQWKEQWNGRTALLVDGKESDRPFMTICNIVELSNHYS